MSWCGAPLIEISWDEGKTWREESSVSIGSTTWMRISVGGKVIWQGKAKPQAGKCLGCDGRGVVLRYFYDSEEK